MTGNIFNIQRFSTNDGSGIRTTVFLKGCPLSCIWCHNPESKSVCPDIFYDSRKCVYCKKCEKICKRNRHIFDSGEHIFLRDNCQKCMECVLECPVNALETVGKEMSVDEVIAEVSKDTEFYAHSGGGVTLSGGEPLMQYDFSLEILKEAKVAGLHTAVETSGYCHKELNEISKYVDIWLYDIKLFSESEHIQHTGVSNKTILKNLYFLDSIGANIILRCPIIPDINLTKEHFDSISDLANKLNNVVAIHFEPYHPLGIDKAINLGRTQEYKNKAFLTAEEISPFVNCIERKTNIDIEIL